MTFSVVLIARNEEKVLPRLISSLVDFQSKGGEVILLDTGSKDNTVNIAREAGFKVTEVGEIYRHTIDAELAEKINNYFIVNGEEKVVVEGDKYFDFASARNHATSLASNDWICSVDADEEFTMFDLEKIEEIIKNEKLGNLEYNFVFSHNDDSSEGLKFIQSKFFNRNKMQWTGTVHEVLSGTGERLFVGEDIFKLEHWQNHETNRHSYLVGLAVDCFNNPDKDRNSHYFARELFWAGRYHSAIKEFERHIAMNAWIAERAESMIYIGDCYGYLNQPEKQTEWYSKAFYTDSTRRKALIKLAYFYQHNKNYLASACYASASLLIPFTGFYCDDKAEYEDIPHSILYVAYGWLGRIEEAKHHITEVLRYKPDNRQYLFDRRFYFGNVKPLVSFIIPTLGREEGLARCIASIRALNYPQQLIEIKIIEGSGTVPEKVALGVADTKGEYIVYASNDVEFAPDSLTEALMIDKHLVAFNTGTLLLDNGNACEHFIIKRDFLSKLENGQIFSKDFHHVGCDNWLMAQAVRLGEYGRADKAIVKHYHFSTGLSEMDETYKKGWSNVEKDREILKAKLLCLK